MFDEFIIQDKVEQTKSDPQKVRVTQKKQYQRISSGNVRYQRNEKKTVIQRVIKPIVQTGSNCGIFAMAMALADITEEDGEGIAVGLEAYARNEGYSAIGEAYDAEDLAQTGQDYCNLNYRDRNIHVEFVTFERENELKDILEWAKEKETYVLFPYFSGPNNVPTDKVSIPESDRSRQVDSTDMEHAHWSVIERRKNEREEEKLHLVEGNLLAYGGVENSYFQDDGSTLRELFLSNMSLSDEMNWTVFWDRSRERLEKMNSKIQEFQEGLIQADGNLAMVDEKMSEVTIELSMVDQILNLREQGKNILDENTFEEWQQWMWNYLQQLAAYQMDIDMRKQQLVEGVAYLEDIKKKNEQYKKFAINQIELLGKYRGNITSDLEQFFVSKRRTQKGTKYQMNGAGHTLEQVKLRGCAIVISKIPAMARGIQQVESMED